MSQMHSKAEKSTFAMIFGFYCFFIANYVQMFACILVTKSNDEESNCYDCDFEPGESFACYNPIFSSRDVENYVWNIAFHTWLKPVCWRCSRLQCWQHEKTRFPEHATHQGNLKLIFKIFPQHNFNDVENKVEHRVTMNLKKIFWPRINFMIILQTLSFRDFHKKSIKIQMFNIDYTFFALHCYLKYCFNLFLLFYCFKIKWKIKVIFVLIAYQ